MSPLELYPKLVETAGYTNLIVSILELLITLTKKDDISHLYGCQFVNLSIRCLIKDKTEGVFGKMTDEEKYHIQELLLETAIHFIWEEDSDSLSQLNGYSVKIMKAIRAEIGFQGLFMRLLDHQARCKAFSLENKSKTDILADILDDKKIRMYGKVKKNLTPFSIF